MITENAVVAAAAGAGSFEMGVKGDITLQLHAHTVCYGTPLLGIPESFPCQICVLQPFTHSTTSKSFLKFKNKVAFVCLFYHLQSCYQVASSKPTKGEG